MTCSGEYLASAKLKWLCFPSSHITVHNFIYVEKLQWEFIPISIALFPIPTLLFPLPQKSYGTHEIPIMSIAMHISNRGSYFLGAPLARTPVKILPW